MPEMPPLPPPVDFPESESSRFWRRFFLLHVLACLGLLGWLYAQTRPVNLPELHLADGERLNCVSYAPYRLPGQTPLDPSMRIPRAQIAADLAALAPLTRCVRIYAVNQGLELVPELAKPLGLKVLLGAWIGFDPKLNQVELDRAVALVNAYPDVVRGLIVGNEVMLRREQSEAGLKALLDSAKARVKVPVTYADVWEFWLRHPSLADSVDFVTIHILPYWEDQPVPVDQALAHVTQVRQRLLDRYGKPILIGETGWPSQGRQREGSRPGRVEQASYIRAFVHQAQAAGWDYNLIEAVDQPWKRYLEGTVGGYWGVLDVHLQANFPFMGPVAERAALWPSLLAALSGGMLCLLVAYRGAGGWRLAALGSAGAWSGMVLLLAWEHALVAYRDSLEWGLLGGIALLGVGFVLGLGRCRDVLAMAAGVAAWQGRTRWCDGRWVLSGLRLFLLFAGAVAALLLLADPRYRDFPYWLYASPALSLLALGWWGWVPPGREERICAALILVCGVGRWLMEPANPQAVAWALLCGVLALAGLARISRESRVPTAEVSKQ